MSGKRQFKENKAVQIPKRFRADISEDQARGAGSLQRAQSTEVFDGDNELSVESDGSVIITGRDELGRVIPPEE